MQEFKFGVIGCGYIGNRHIDMIKSVGTLAVVCDVNFRYTYDVPMVSTIEEMMQYEFDILCVCTPNGLHYEHALKGLQSGRHIIVEKPMALSKSDCEDLIYTSIQNNRHIFCVMQNRYSPPSQWVKSVVESGILGSIYMVKIDCFWNRDHRYYKGWKGSLTMDGGTLFTQFSHFIDIMYWLFGDITNISAKMYDFNHPMTDFDDSGMVTFDFVKGGAGSLNFSTSVFDSNLESTLTIIAENGSIKIGGQYMNEVQHCHIRDYEMPQLAESNPPNDYGHYKGSAMNHNHVFENVVSTLRGESKITTNALEGMKVVDIIERMYNAS